MLISHQHKFIFIKTKKTAGTSLEIALSKYLGADDVITPISPEDQHIRNTLGYRGPQNYCLPYRHYSGLDYLKLFAGKKLSYYNHIPALKVRAYLGEPKWNSYYKFCIERNPWEKTISAFYFRYPDPQKRLPISEFINSREIEGFQSFEIYTQSGKAIVDFIGRYEKLDEDLAVIAKRIGLTEPLILPRAKSGFRADKRPYTEILSDSEQERIRQVFSREIALLGY